MRQAELAAARTMVERAHDRFDLWPERLTADIAYGTAEMLNWLVHERGIEPHMPVFDKSRRDDGTFSRSDFAFDAADAYTCPAGKTLVAGSQARSRECVGLEGTVEGRLLLGTDRGAPEVEQGGAAARIRG